ncbi:MAG TPA: BON domain-containing protein [Thermoanaerobaculia bacterium]|jgi:hyperosmotically inducible protein|nr:BON domain-containing protein [Thermoanaerobaculia bacterium]
MTLIKGIAISFLACCALAIAGCSSTMVPEKTRDLDSAISSKIDESLEDSADVKARQVNIQTHEGVVYLTGVVDSEDARREAGRIAWRTAGVDGVVNDLTVGERTVGDWVDDTLISSRLKAQLIADTGVRASDIDVSSSQGVVTLIGRVRTSAMKQDAERIARGIKGVTDVHNELVVGRVIG